MKKFLDMYRAGYILFSKAVYQNHIYAGTINDPETVHNDFMQDITNKRPACVAANSRSVYVSFNDGGYLAAYMLPLEYIKYTGGVTI